MVFFKHFLSVCHSDIYQLIDGSIYIDRYRYIDVKAENKNPLS